MKLIEVVEALLGNGDKQLPVLQVKVVDAHPDVVPHVTWNVLTDLDRSGKPKHIATLDAPMKL